MNPASNDLQSNGTESYAVPLPALLVDALTRQLLSTVASISLRVTTLEVADATRAENEKAAAAATVAQHNQSAANPITSYFAQANGGNRNKKKNNNKGKGNGQNGNGAKQNNNNNKANGNSNGN